MAIAVRRMRESKYKFATEESAIMYYRSHPVDACEDLLGIKLIWLQRIVLRNIWFKRFPLLNMGRGVGKSFMIAIACVLIALLYPRTKVGIIAPVFRQANFVFDYVDEIWDQSEYVQASTAKRASRGVASTILKFGNGSFIEALPVGDGTKIRGRRYNVALIDEYAQMDETIIKLVIRPMLNIKRGRRENKLIVASTAYYRWNHFWTLYLFYIKNILNGFDDYSICEYDYIDVQNTPNSPYQIDAQMIRMQKNDMTWDQFRMENLAVFPSDTVGFISAKLIDTCTPKQYPIEPELTQEGMSLDDVYVMGVDAARAEGGDNFALVVLKIKNKTKKVVFSYTMNGVTYQEMTAAVRSAFENFNISRIHMGAGGGGLTLKDLLAEAWKTADGNKMLPLLDMDDALHQAKDGLKIIKIVKESAPKNNELYMNLKAEMQHKRLQFPLDVKSVDRESQKFANVYREILALKQELMVLEAIPNASGTYFKFTVPAKYKKDRATSLVMANDAALDLAKSDRVETFGELPVGFFV